MEEDAKLPEWNMLVLDDDETLCMSAVENLKKSWAFTQIGQWMGKKGSRNDRGASQEWQ